MARRPDEAHAGRPRHSLARGRVTQRHARPHQPRRNFIELFLASHCCNDLCRKLHLPHNNFFAGGGGGRAGGTSLTSKPTNQYTVIKTNRLKQRQGERDMETLVLQRARKHGAKVPGARARRRRVRYRRHRPQGHHRLPRRRAAPLRARALVTFISLTNLNYIPTIKFQPITQSSLNWCQSERRHRHPPARHLRRERERLVRKKELYEGGEGAGKAKQLRWRPLSGAQPGGAPAPPPRGARQGPTPRSRGSLSELMSSAALW